MLGRHGAERCGSHHPGPAGATVLIGCAALVLALSGCGTVFPAQQATPTGAPEASLTPDGPAGDAATPPALVPGGTAEENRAFFDSVGQRVLAGEPEAGGRTFIDALVAAGFKKSDMEVTEDQTAIGNDVDALQFSVKVGESCLIGERSSTGYASVVAPLLGTGTCLIGETRVIDW